jgi:hypothetical protein
MLQPLQSCYFQTDRTCEPYLCFLTTLKVFALMTLMISLWSRHSSSEPSAFHAMNSGRAVTFTVPMQRELRASHNLRPECYQVA